MGSSSGGSAGGGPGSSDPRSDDEYIDEDDDLASQRDGSGKGKIRKKKTRTVFSRSQVFQLESTFDLKRYLSSSERAGLAASLQLTETQVHSSAHVVREWSSTRKTGYLGTRNWHLKLQFKYFIWVGGNISFLVGCIKILSVSPTSQDLSDSTVESSLNCNPKNVEKCCRDKSCGNPKRYPKNGAFHRMIPWVYNHHYEILNLVIRYFMSKTQRKVLYVLHTIIVISQLIKQYLFDDNYLRVFFF